MKLPKWGRLRATDKVHLVRSKLTGIARAFIQRSLA
jgi:hypothetical protein